MRTIIIAVVTVLLLQAVAAGQSAFAPWTPAGDRVDRYDASLYWNATHRGGRVEGGFLYETTEFTPVAEEYDDAVHNGFVQDHHFSATFAFALIEQVRVRVGGGATLSYLRTAAADAPRLEYGPGWNLRFGITASPLFRWVPRQVFTPVLEADVLYHEAKAGGTALHATFVRLALMVQWEFFRDYQAGCAAGLLFGVGYHHYFGWLTLPDRSVDFTSPGGDGATYLWGDVDAILGITLVVADAVTLQAEVHSGTPTIRVSLVIYGP